MTARTHRDRDLWVLDHVVTAAGVAVPVRATARRPTWDQLPVGVRAQIEAAAGSAVTCTWSAGTGFTPGFASRLDLADGRQLFVKAASTVDDTTHGWPMSGAYREEARKLAALGPAVGAPPLLWTRSFDHAGVAWIVLGFAYVDARPPRRPWRADELDTVLAALVSLAPALRMAPTGLELEPLAEHLLTDLPMLMAELRAADTAGAESWWLDRIAQWCADGATLLAGSSIVHMDLRDDNVLIGRDGDVWLVDWNWPVLGPDWVDAVCLLLSARGDGHDVEAILARHPLTRRVPARAVDCLLATLWCYWAVAARKDVPHGSPHLRDHQAWYRDVTRQWLDERAQGRAR